MQRRVIRAVSVFSSILAISAACSDDASTSGTGGNEAESTTDTGGDPTGDGDGDPSECEAGQEQCKGAAHESCVDGVWQADPCPELSFCDERSDSCQTCLCTPGELGACADPDQIEVCSADCSAFVPSPCADDGVCLDGACLDLICAPNQLGCADEDSLQACNDSGTAWLPGADCDPGDQCLDGTCLTKCEIAGVTKSNIGCEFWAVDMANVPPRDAYTYAITISNPSFDEFATVRIYDKRTGVETLLLDGNVAPRDVEVFNISGSHDGNVSFYNGMDAGFLGNGIGQGTAFRVETDLPVVATQFNPIGGAIAFTTDASLLLPSQTLGVDYIHLDWNLGLGSGASMNLVATEDDTTVMITSKVSTNAGTNGLPALVAGVPTAVVLDAYDYIQLAVNDQNLTGSQISSDKPVALFGGHSCAAVPTEMVGLCDHIEEQIFPLDTWGTNVVAARNPQRAAEAMRWRIVASEDNTTVTFNPALVSIGGQIVLNANQFIEFDEINDFYISADDPILVAGYMHGGSVAPGNVGDPYMVLMVPVEQYRDDYVFLVDFSYDSDFAKLVRPAGAEVTVECLGVVPEDRWTAVGNSGWEHATIDMNPGEAMCGPGTNSASSAEGFGVIISGQATSASYAYPGGLALAPINPQ